MMSNTHRPLTPSELSDLKAKAKAAHKPRSTTGDLWDFTRVVTPETILRLIHTVERRDEQIEKLRAALNYHGAHDGGCAGGKYCTCGYTQALASTEPK